jgi:peptidoglycan-N-acetylglucosamine deacetylase
MSFDVDNATIALSRGDLGAADLSRGEYGAIDGLPRILRLLDQHNIAATFFIPAVAAALHPHMIGDILANGDHEIGSMVGSTNNLWSSTTIARSSD